MTDISKHINDILAVVREAGTRIEAVRREGMTVDTKADDSPVTRADREADSLLREALPRILPAGWLSEETKDDQARLGQERVWIVDPLDGTKEFVAGVPEYAVAVALVEHGEPILGVIHNPVSGDAFWAVRGEGAYRDGSVLRVAESDRMLASRSEVKRGEFEPFTEWDVRPTGSIAFKLALIAAGEGGATISRGPKHEWDVCAGAILVAEAGGRVGDAFGAPLGFNHAFPKVKGILAGAPAAYERCLALVRDIGASDRMQELA